MKPHSFPTEKSTLQKGAGARKLALLLGIGLASTTVVAHAAGKVAGTRHGEVVIRQAPLQTPNSTHPFATAAQRAAATPLRWNQGNSVLPERPASRRPSRPGASPGGGPEPSFGNYLARSHFPEAWEAVDAAAAAEAARPPLQGNGTGDITTQDGAHYGYRRLAGNYDTTQWTAPPWNKTGKLYFTTPDGGAHYCTASLVSGDSIVATAAHCVYTRGRDWNDNFVFVPAERYGVAPYGTYRWTSGAIDLRWVDYGGHSRGVGLIRVGREASSGLKVVDYVGWLGRSWNLGYMQPVYSHAYAGSLSTQYTNICVGWTYSSPTEGTNVLTQGCDMTDASGGAWLINYTPYSHAGNHVNSVISGPHAGAFGTAHVGPRFNDDNIVEMCRVFGC